MADCANCPSKNTCSSQGSCEIKNNPYSNVKHVIGVMSGKGGVGKSTVSALLAKALFNMGYKVGIMDADITGPSIPRLLGIKDAKVEQSELGLLPAQAGGLSVVSLNLLIEDEMQPVIWRGPMLAGIVKQFWEEVFWGELDYLIIDMPPGTGDVPLTVMQSIPISGIVIVSVPQDMVSMIVAKAANMVKMMNIKLIGLVQNFSKLDCPHCGEPIRLYGDEQEAFLSEHDIRLLGELPMKPSLAQITEKGLDFNDTQIKSIANDIAKKMTEGLKTDKTQ